jgi:hypothetical protein
MRKAFQRPAISKGLLLRLRREFRRSPEVLRLFELYDDLYESSITSDDIPQDWTEIVADAIMAASRTIKRSVPDIDSKSFRMYLRKVLTAASPALRRVEKNPDDRTAFTRLSTVMWEFLAGIVRMVGIEPQMKTLPGKGRFLGMGVAGDVDLPDVPEDVATAFTAEESRKPVLANQPARDLDELYVQADEAFEEQLDLLNRGTGLDRAIGAKVFDISMGQFPDYTEPGPMVVIGPQKKRARVLEKALADDVDIRSVLDIVRSTVAVDKASDIPEVMAYLRQMGIKIARRPKNRFNTPTSVGYRDLMFNIEYPNGHIGELQINLKPMLRAKDIGHEYYEIVRSIESAMKAESRTVMTPHERDAVEDANRIQKELYDEAWRMSVRGLPKTSHRVTYSHEEDSPLVSILARSEHRSGNLEYFEYDNSPAYVNGLNLPVRVTPGGKEVIIKDLQKFYREAIPLSSMMYEKLLRLTKRG